MENRCVNNIISLRTAARSPRDTRGNMLTKFFLLSTSTFIPGSLFCNYAFDDALTYFCYFGFLVWNFDMLIWFVVLVSFLKIMFSNRWRKSCQNSAVPMCVPHMFMHIYSGIIIIKSPSLCTTTLARVSQNLRSYFSHMVASC